MTDHTDGPWRWELNLKFKQLRLCGGRPRYDLTVMDFVRWGMGGAAPRLRRMSEPMLNIMTKVQEFARIVAGREHHAEWFQDVDHPDMRLIAAAPDLLGACEKMKEVALEQMGFRTYSKCEQDAIDGVIAAVKLAKEGRQ